MYKKSNIIAMIPARLGSTRLKMKNLALINGRPLISYAIKAAKASEVFRRVVVNSDNEIFAEIAKRYKVEFYLRPAELGSSTTKSDEVVYDFMLHYHSNILAWINPTSPAQTGDEIREITDYFKRETLDTLITVKNEYLHCIFNGKPVNFRMDELFTQTQNLEPVQCFVYSMMMWRDEVFLETFKKQRYAFLCGKIGYYPASRQTSIIIKTKEDLMFAEYIMKKKKLTGEYQVKYDKIVKELKYKCYSVDASFK